MSGDYNFADRRQLKRSLTFWRVVAIGVGVLSVLAIGLIAGQRSGALRGEHIAQVAVEGLITEDLKQLEQYREIAEDDRVKALIVRINSTGGTTTGGEALFGALRKISEKKPTVAVFGTVAASAGYMVGIATDYVIARENTITGSVGVIAQWVEVSDLLEKLGVKPQAVRSGELKARPSPLEKSTEQGLKETQEMVSESNKWFQGLVRDRRQIAPDLVPGLKDGGIFSGRDALRFKLIDAIGGKPEALEYLRKERDISADLKVVEYEKPRTATSGLFSRAFTTAAQKLGLPSSLTRLIAGQGAEFDPGSLDGLYSVWHPSR